MKNKIFGLMLSVIMMTTLIPSALAAESVITISGGDVTGVPLTVSLSDGTEANGTWQISTNGIDFTDKSLNSYTDTVNAYAIKPTDKNKYIRYAQEIDGEVIYSNVVGPLPASKGPNTNTNNSSDWQGLSKSPNADYIFKPADGQSFTLLDTTNASTDGLFVIANNGYGRVLVGNNGKFDPSNSDSLASKLASLAETGSWSADWYGNAKTFSLPTSIKNNLKEHSWLTDAGHADSATPADYIYSGKLSVLSYTEWMQYKSIIGYRLSANAGADWWTLRTGSASGAGTMHVIWQQADVSNSGRVMNQPMNRLPDIRPCFYLDKDYFLNNKIDVESAGSVVKEYIRSNYTKEELMSGGAAYTLVEVAAFGYENELEVEIFFDGEPFYVQDSENAGFTTGVPWIRVNGDYKECNAKVQLEDSTSTFNYYKSLMNLRKASKATLVYGDFKPIETNDETFCFYRESAESKFYIEMNLTENIIERPVPIEGECLLSNYFVSANKLRAYEVNIYRVKK